MAKKQHKKIVRTLSNKDKKLIEDDQKISKSFQRAITINLQPHQFFTIVAFIFGLCFMLTTPPFQVADEITHFGRVYKLSEFETIQKFENGISGDSVPASLGKISTLFRDLCWQPQNKTTKGKIINTLKVSLQPGVKVYDRIDAGEYFYFSYLPQLPIVLIGRFFEFNTLYILYFGRFFALIFFVVCVRYAIKIIPIGKYLLMTIALLPMTLAQAASFNADCVTFSLSFLGISMIMKRSFSDRPFNRDIEFYMLAAIILIFGILKPTYLPLAALLLIIRPFYRKIYLSHFLLCAIIMFGSFFSTYLWRSLASRPYQTTATKINDTNLVGSSIIGEGVSRLEMLLNSPGKIIDLYYNTYNYFGEMYYKSTIGILGYLDTVLPIQVYFLFGFLILFIALFESNSNFKLSLYQRSFLFFISFGVILLTILAMYTRTRQDAGLIAEGVQGRYFIPALFPFFISLYGLLPFKIDFSRRKIITGILYIVLIYLLSDLPPYTHLEVHHY